MKKNATIKVMFLTVLFLLSFSLKGQDPIIAGVTDTIHSKVLGENRAVWIYRPDMNGNETQNNKKYPVLYLLDGDWHFLSVAGMVQQLSVINGNTVCPEMMIVGIPAADRFRDFTPTTDSAVSPTSGGYSQFMSFISKELIPYIDSAYAVAPYRMIVGHSLGGLCVINTLMRTPSLFNAYVAIDPSMWWHNQFSLKEAASTLSDSTFHGQRLFLAIANTMERDMDTARVRRDATYQTLHIRSVLQLADLLKNHRKNGLDFSIKYYEKENHGSVPFIATYDALHFVFDFYPLSLTKGDMADTSMALAYRIENHFKQASMKLGFDVFPSESLINALGYNALMLKNPKLAGFFFQMNIVNYPQSANAWDSYGDYFSAMNEPDTAISMYEKSLSISENASTRQKLEELRTKNN